MALDTTPDYRAFARDLVRLCRKHGVRIRAHDGGFVDIGAVGSKRSDYENLEVSPAGAEFGDTRDVNYFKM